MSEKKEIEGLGGWLILVGIGIVLSPVKILLLLYPLYSEIFLSGAWEILTTPGSEAYNPLWGPIVSAEIIINFGLVITWIYIAILFFTKKKIFPKWYLGIIIFSLVFIFLDAHSIKIVLPNEPVYDPDTVKELVRSFVAAIIWVPYMLKSERVKATFIK